MSVKTNKPGLRMLIVSEQLKPREGLLRQPGSFYTPGSLL